MKLTAKIAAVVALATGFLLGSATTTSPRDEVQVESVATTISYSPASLPTRPCADDSDDKNCYWDAAKRGNGKGYSYYVDRSGKVTYLNPKLNDPAKREAWAKTNKAAHREYWGTVWGHRLCWAKVGDTSYIYCFDGHRETS
jgi:hypothetical protein